MRKELVIYEHEDGVRIWYLLHEILTETTSV